MHLLARRMVGACCAGLLSFTLCTEAVSAVNSGNIRGAYGLGSSRDVDSLKQELLQVQHTIRSVKEIEVYNTVIASMTTDEIDAKIAKLTKSADMTRQQVIGGIDLPLEELLRCEAEYKDVVSKLDTLLRVRDFYNIEPSLTPDEDLATLLDAECSLQSSIEEAGYYEDIGSLEYYPVLGKTYRINSPFGSRYDPVGVRGHSFHYGVDLYAPEGTPIGAWFSGTVVRAGTAYGPGNYIWLDHGHGVKTFYCHLSRIDVSVGQHIPQGTQIALSGNTGYYTTGPHLHLGLYIDGTAVDPQVLLE